MCHSVQASVATEFGRRAHKIATVMHAQRDPRASIYSTAAMTHFSGASATCATRCKPVQDRVVVRAQKRDRNERRAVRTVCCTDHPSEMAYRRTMSGADTARLTPPAYSTARARERLHLGDLPARARPVPK